MTPAERLALHPRRHCEALGCTHEVDPVLGELHQSGAALSAVIYECPCGNWKRYERLKEG